MKATTKKKTKPSLKRKTVKKTTKKKPQKSNILGKVTHYFDKINVAVVKLSATLRVGDYVEFEGHNGKFSQIVDSIQLDHKPIPQANKGIEIGLKVLEKVNDSYVMKKAEQPSLLNNIPKVEEKKAYEYKPIFPNFKSQSAKPQPQPVTFPQSAPTPQVSRPAPIPKPNSGKEGYGGVKFLKF